jgi:hypothetical protein
MRFKPCSPLDLHNDVAVPQVVREDVQNPRGPSSIQLGSIDVAVSVASHQHKCPADTGVLDEVCVRAHNLWESVEVGGLPRVVLIEEVDKDLNRETCRPICI